MLRGFLIFFFLNTVLGSNIRFSAQMSNNAKKNMKQSEDTN